MGAERGSITRVLSKPLCPENRGSWVRGSAPSCPENKGSWVRGSAPLCPENGGSWVSLQLTYLSINRLQSLCCVACDFCA